MNIPLYQKIINSLIGEIKAGKYGADDKLPSEKELTEAFSTSRITVTRALQEMESKKLIYRIKGKGSFVSPAEDKASPGLKIISLVLPHKEDFFSGGQQYSRQISKSCQKNGYLCSIHFSENSSRREKQILEDIAGHNVAGAIIYPISNRNIDTLSRMSIEGFPIVLLDRNLRELNLPVVTSDNMHGAFEAVTYLADSGHTRIGFVGEIDSDVVSLRYQGYCRALTKSRIVLNPSIAITKFSTATAEEQAVLGSEEAVKILKTLLEHEVTAVFCVNDLVAFMIMQAADYCGIKIPEDLSLVGFDNLKYFSGSQMELTTVAQDFKTIAINSVASLINIIDNGPQPEPANIVVPTTFLEGNSVSNSNYETVDRKKRFYE